MFTVCAVLLMLDEKPQTNTYPISLRYEKISRGESLDLPSFTLVTLTGTPGEIHSFVK